MEVRLCNFDVCCVDYYASSWYIRAEVLPAPHVLDKATFIRLFIHEYYL